MHTLLHAMHDLVDVPSMPADVLQQWLCDGIKSVNLKRSKHKHDFSNNFKDESKRDLQDIKTNILRHNAQIFLKTVNLYLI